MSTVTVRFTPTHDVLNATTSLHRRTIPCRACLKLRLDQRERFRSCHSESCEQFLGFRVWSRKESRGLQCGTIALLGRNLEGLFGSPGRGRGVRAWCVSAEAVPPARESQSPAEDLRAQLEALQQEAEQVRSKANSARLRFMRLTRVVEQLRQRAVMDIRMGKDDTARRLLLEKQKVMKALEASRQRAELLEQLAGKLNVAISMKESLLIAALSSAPLSVGGAADVDTTVHHVSPNPDGLSNEESNQREVDKKEDVPSKAGVNSGQD